MESNMKRTILTLVVIAIGASMAFGQSQVKKETVAGITNLARIETTVACAGAIKPESVAEIKKMGFVSIVNLRPATEPGADVEAEAAAAKAAGLKYVHIPFVTASPDPTAVDTFVKAMTESGVQPAFIHCSGGNRAAAMWFVKRVLLDKWDNDRAMEEATQLGFTSEPLKTFMVGYIQSHKK
jgi:uncharacterized protein (TIGR01244 family)